MVLFDRARFSWLVVLGITPANSDALSASLSVADKSGARLTVERPSPDDRKSLSGEVFHKVRLFHQVKGVTGPTDLRTVGDR